MNYKKPQIKRQPLNSKEAALLYGNCKWCNTPNPPNGSFCGECGGDGIESLVKEGEILKYTVRVDDNYHYMDASERYTLGVYETCEKAVSACKRIVDEFLVSGYKVGTTADELYLAYTTFGEDPFISSADMNCKFSAWTFAKARCEELCG